MLPYLMRLSHFSPPARPQAEDQLSALKRDYGGDETDTKRERSRVEKHQMELDRLGATLKQIETYNEEMKGEIAVTRRAAYAAEGAVQKLEKEKLQQDLRCDCVERCEMVWTGVEQRAV